MDGYLRAFTLPRMLTLAKASRSSAGKDTLVILADTAQLRHLDLERSDRQYLIEQLGTDAPIAVCDISGRLVMVHQVKKGAAVVQLEKARRAGNEMAQRLIGFLISQSHSSFLRVDTTEAAGLAPWLTAQGLAPVGSGISMRRGGSPLPAAPVQCFALAAQALG